MQIIKQEQIEQADTCGYFCSEAEAGKIGSLKTAYARGLFTGKKAESYSYFQGAKLEIYYGTGTEQLTEQELRVAIGSMVQLANGQKSKCLAFPKKKFNSAETRIVAEAAVLANYQFNNYLSEAKSNSVEVVLIPTEDSISLSLGILLGEETNRARALMNEPNCQLHPADFVKIAGEVSKEAGFELEIWDEEKIVAAKMEAFYAVAKGSVHAPYFIIMRYNGKPESEKRLGLVGKGVMFDSGGYNLKPGTSMEDMYGDMAGGAAVLAAMSAIAKNKLAVNVVAVVAACENKVSGNSYVPGDIIGSMSGKTIYIVNTDAEGRLTLADAVYYLAVRESVSAIVDIATLTGAAEVALGDTVTLIVSNDDTLNNAYAKAVELSGEQCWRMPILPEFKEWIQGETADLKNSGGRKASSITAALFVGAFAQDLPWLHLDIAGSSWQEKASSLGPKGATGVGVRSLYHLAAKFEELV
ncbi:MAG: leucyl aminopeptidase [Clostridia bacterium]